MREASLRPSHFSLPAAMVWAGQWWWDDWEGVQCSGAAVRRCGGAAVRRCGGAAVRRCGGAAVRRCSGAGVRLVLAHDEELDQSGLASAHAAARLGARARVGVRVGVRATARARVRVGHLVDDVREEDVLGGEREAHELAVVTARLAGHRLAKVLVVQLAVLRRRPAHHAWASGGVTGGR
eukprot:scaffold14126_cov58-Phaeocystis_antarctica.AAC.3